jgi:hypothetical protein
VRRANEKRAADRDGVGSRRLRVFDGRDNGRVGGVSRTVYGSELPAQEERAKLVTEVERGQVTTGHRVAQGRRSNAGEEVPMEARHAGPSVAPRVYSHAREEGAE